jgi:two-component system chemotaxis response regulator CheY
MSLKEQIRVMVVDDMATSRGLIINALSEIGIKNYTFENSGDAAFKALATTPVHLILSDQNMPGMSGLELLKAVRSNQPTARTGFILITGSPDPQLVQTGIKLGLNNFIKKPFSTPQLKQCIEKVVGRLG